MITCSESGRFELHAGLFSAHAGRVVVKLDNAVYVFASPGQQGLVCLENVETSDQAFSLTLKNLSDRELRVEEICIEFPGTSFLSPRQAKDHCQLVHSFCFDTLSGVKPVHIPTDMLDVNPDSGLMTVYSDNRTHQALLLGAVPPFGSGFTFISTLHDARHNEGTFGIKIRFEICQTLPAGGFLTTPPVVAFGEEAGEELIERYAQLLRRRLGRFTKPAVTGWNSWDYYRGTVTQDVVKENILSCRQRFGDQLQYMVLDEGWECQWGVWQANWKFPDGLEGFCHDVRIAGYIPGIWTAPLMVNFYAPLYREHPDWFLSDALGNVHLTRLSYGPMAQLDITRPEVQQHLREVYTQLRNVGFEYFKVDFTQRSLEAPGVYDPMIGRANLLRNLFQLIRECIGEESYLLACGAPFEAVIGIVDSMRTSGDIHNYWGHIRQNLHSIFSRLWMQGTIANTDPDFLIVRCSETSQDPHLNPLLPICPRKVGGIHWEDGTMMNLEEARCLALGIYMTGGDLVLGDAIAQLNSTGIDLISKVMPPLPSPARHLNRFDPESFEAPILLAETENEHILAIFNLSDFPCTKHIDSKLFGNITDGVDFWTNDPIAIGSDLMLRLQPRSTMGIRFSKKNQ